MVGGDRVLRIHRGRHFRWGTSRRNAGLPLHDALNNATPRIFDTVIEDGVEKRVLNARRPRPPRKSWRGSRRRSPLDLDDPDRTDRLARVYNDRFNNLVRAISTDGI